MAVATTASAVLKVLKLTVTAVVTVAVAVIVPLATTVATTTATTAVTVVASVTASVAYLVAATSASVAVNMFYYRRIVAPPSSPSHLESVIVSDSTANTEDPQCPSSH